MVLGDPTRLRTRNSYGYLVGRKHKLHVDSDDEARALAQRLLADPHNVAQLRAGLGQPEAALEELESWLASGGLLALPGAQWALEVPGGIEESGVADGSGRIFLPTIEFASVGRLVVTPPSPA